MTVKFLSGCFSFCTRKLAITGLFRGRDKRILKLYAVCERQTFAKQGGRSSPRQRTRILLCKTRRQILSSPEGSDFASQNKEDIMNVLVINCGSSSLKYQLIDSESEAVMAKGLCERIGIEDWYTRRPDWTKRLQKLQCRHTSRQSRWFLMHW